MRILCTFAGGNGHFEPLLPLARAAMAAGHTVAFSGEPLMMPRVEATGFPAFPSGPSFGSTGEKLPLLPVDREREDRDLRDGFIRRAGPHRAADLLTLCAHWRPDLIVHDEIDFGALVVAERLGLPHAAVEVTAAGALLRPSVFGAALDELRTAHGLPPDPGMTAAARHLVLSPFPASFRDPAFPPPPTLRTYRHAVPEPAASRPSWHTGRPVVYFTLGTIFNTESGDLFDRVLTALGELPVTAVVTLGSQLDPGEFGPQPDHLHLARFIPQAELLPHCDLVVSHGGSGTVLGALNHGLPQVLIPMGGDQPGNGDRCTALGLGRTLDAVAVTSAEVRDTVAAVLEDPGPRTAALRLQREIDRHPSPAHAVELLGRLG